MKFFLIALPVCVLGFSCERHDFEETKKLHHAPEAHGASHNAGHGDAHGAENAGDHGKKEDGHGH